MTTGNGPFIARLRDLALDLHSDVEADPERPRVLVNRATLREVLVLIEQLSITDATATDRGDVR